VFRTQSCTRLSITLHVRFVSCEVVREFEIPDSSRTNLPEVFRSVRRSNYLISCIKSIYNVVIYLFNGQCFKNWSVDVNKQSFLSRLLICQFRIFLAVDCLTERFMEFL
jgi:hypothetical protein